MIRFLFIALFFCVTSLSAQVRNVWIDADTANDIDDIYAIARLVFEDKVNFVGLSSAHFNNADLVVYDNWNQYKTKDICTVKLSQDINEKFIELSGRKDIVCAEGADRQVGCSWGGFEPRPSEAVTAIVDYVNSMPADEYLDIICLGPVTNLASAIMLNPEIISRIRCYIMGAQYSTETGVWNKNEFNVRNDLNAFDYLIGLDSVCLYVMSATTSYPYIFEKEDTYKRLSGKHHVKKFILNRWEETEPESFSRTFWDLALVEAYLHPELSLVEERPVPPENGNHKVNVYLKIDEKKLFDDFWNYIDGLN